MKGESTDDSRAKGMQIYAAERSPMSKAHYRKSTFIDPSVQGTLVKRVVMHWICFIVTSIAAITLLQMVLGDPSKTIAEHMESAAKQYALFFIVMLTLLPAFVLDTIRLSHRFAGPIYRLRQTFRTVAAGKAFQPIRFRNGDFWKDIAGEFNEMMEALDAPMELPATPEATEENSADHSVREAVTARPDVEPTVSIDRGTVHDVDLRELSEECDTVTSER